MKRILGLLAIICLMTACGGMGSIKFEEQAEKEKIFSQSLDEVWPATMNTITEMGYAITTTNKGTGVIGTDYKVTKQVILLISGYRHRLNILLSSVPEKSTKVFIKSFFERQSTDDSKWQQVHRTKDLIDLERGIFGKIESNLKK